MKHFIKIVAKNIGGIFYNGIFHYKNNMDNVINGFRNVSIIDNYYVKYCTNSKLEFSKKPHVHVFDGIELIHFWIIIKNGVQIEFNSYEEYLMAYNS